MSRAADLRSRIPAGSEVLARRRLFQTPYIQSQVSRAVKRVEDWLQSIKADPPARRDKRTIVTNPGRNEPRPRVSGGGRRVVRKAVDEDED
jgi:hypothetical protein